MTDLHHEPVRWTLRTCSAFALGLLLACDSAELDDGGASAKTERGARTKADGELAPPEWNCSAQYYDARDGCDCGCGAPDPDCAEATIEACDYEWCKDEPVEDQPWSCSEDIDAAEQYPGPACEGQLTPAGLLDLFSTRPVAEFKLPRLHPEDESVSAGEGIDLGELDRRIYLRTCDTQRGCSDWQEEQPRHVWIYRRTLGTSWTKFDIANDAVIFSGDVGLWEIDGQFFLGLATHSKYEATRGLRDPGVSPDGFAITERGRSTPLSTGGDNTLLLGKNYDGSNGREWLPRYADEMLDRWVPRETEFTMTDDCMRAVEGPFEVDRREFGDGVAQWTEWVRVYHASFEG